MAYGLAVSGAKVAIIGRVIRISLIMSQMSLLTMLRQNTAKDIVVKGYSCNVIDKEELNKTYEIIKSELEAVIFLSMELAAISRVLLHQ